MIPDSAYADPLDDPLLAQFVQSFLFAEVHTLEDMKQTFVDFSEGHLNVGNEQGQFETWEALLDRRGFDLNLTERFPVLSYQGNLYTYGDTYSSREDAERAIEKEIGK